MISFHSARNTPVCGRLKGIKERRKLRRPRAGEPILFLLTFVTQIGHELNK